MDLVLVHAFPLDSRLWENQARTLAGVARVHAPDLPGFGRDPGPAARTVGAMADAVREFVATRGLDRFVLGGMSMGGYVALAYVHRFGTSGLAGLVLADTRADADTPEGRRGRDESIALVRTQGPAPLADRLLPRLIAPSAPAAMRSRVRSWICDQRPESIVSALEAMRDRPDSTQVLPRIDVPTLVVGGTLDLPSPRDVLHSLAAAIPGACLRLIEDVGHLSNLEAPQAFDDHLRAFLRGVPTRSVPSTE